MNPIALAALAAIACQSQTPPVIHLPFDGGLHDRGTAAIMITAAGDDIRVDRGIKGSALFVGGTSDWIEAPLPNGLRFQDGATIEFWVRRDGWVNPYPNGAGTQTLLYLHPFIIDLRVQAAAEPDRNEIRATILRDPEEPVDLRSGYSLPAHQWAHVALVITKRSATLYLNVERAARVRRWRGWPERRPVPLKVGTWHGPNQAFRGWFDDVKVYDYARTRAQISESVAVPVTLTPLPRDQRSFFERFKLLIVGLPAAIIWWGLLSSIVRARKSAVSVTWPRGSGRMISAQVVEHRHTGDSPSYTIAVEYEYEAAGQKYRGTKFSFADDVTWMSAGKPNALLRNYRPGAHVLPYYNPADPAEAVLEPSLGRRLYLLIVLGSAILLGLGYYLWRTGV